MALDPYETEDHARFGKILLRWGHIEIALVNIILRLTHPLFGLPDHDGVPYPFTQKIKLAKRGYREITEMAPLRGEAVQALSAIRPLNAMRNIIVHGNYQGFTAAIDTCLACTKDGADEKAHSCSMGLPPQNSPP